MWNTGATAIRYFNGQICQVALFTSALTLAQIQQLYNACGVPFTIVTQPPATVSANAGQVVSIPITAKGPPTLTYQWYNANGTAVAGQTTTALSFNPVAQANAGGDYAVVSNSGGAATSSVRLTAVRPS